MTRSGLVRHLIEDRKLGTMAAALVVDTIFEGFRQAILRNEPIDVRGFGAFRVRRHKGYQGRNPRTGALIEVGPKRIPHFRPSTELSARMNEAATR